MWKVVPSPLLKIFPSLENRLKVFLLIICVITISIWFIEAIISVFLLVAVTSSSDPQFKFNASKLSPFLIVTDSLERPVFIIGIVSLLLQILFGIATSWNIMSAPRGKNAVTYLQILTRGFLAGVAVCTHFPLYIKQSSHCCHYIKSFTFCCWYCEYFPRNDNHNYGLGVATSRKGCRAGSHWAHHPRICLRVCVLYFCFIFYGMVSKSKYHWGCVCRHICILVQWRNCHFNSRVFIPKMEGKN